MNEKVLNKLDDMSDDDLGVLMTQSLAMSPWQGAPPGSLAHGSGGPATDEDGFSLAAMGDDFSYKGFSEAQAMCWRKFNENPFVYTTVVDTTGRLTGKGFKQVSSNPKVNDVMESMWEDPRNNLVNLFSKYVARSEIQGELFLCVTVHKNGFVEVDFISPTVVKGFKNNSGILTPENKPMFPLMYRIQKAEGGEKFIPSINMAFYPELWAELDKIPEWKTASITKSKVQGYDRAAKYSKLKNHKQFILQFDQGFVTARNVGRLKVALEWLNHYDNIKKWELDHKKSSGAYLWTIEVEDRSSFRLWMSMSDEDKKATGLMSAKVPGGTIMLPPGFKMTCNNPKLASITNQDDDILRMVSAGLNTSEDQMTGSSSGQTFGGVKMSRGPISDRVSDKQIDLERWMIHGFWRGVLWLHSQVAGMPWESPKKVAYKFEDGKPKFKTIKVPAHKTITMNFPISAMGDLEAKAKALLGSKHGALNSTLGISNEDIADKLGFQNYHQSRLDKATEEENYPELISEEEEEQRVENNGELGAKKVVKDTKPVTPPVDNE